MEQQNEVLTDKVSMTDSSTVHNTFILPGQESEVHRVRKILLVLISILLFLGFINFIFILHSYTSVDLFNSQLPNNSSQFVSIIISIFYYGFGLLVTYRYYQTGLLVFGWLGSVSLLLILVIALVILIGTIVTTSRLGVTKGIIVAIIFIIVCLTASLLQIFTVRYAFILSKLLNNVKHFTIDRI
ncbi:unnamed protein product [Rotaria magnacalcarata]|uniref:Uncharacterized protein n=1 Tax=Rotaria magnacalcarata TaxID=392030 RepID=A0A816E3L2_9BILA|nr:unnamed protein product [Rotaria magnacalcarata]CAF1644754.1 unnamed protein product [Rotaria magnacalcarata]CAF2051058.1 unnamed protein product [Rotaria magnacalcarata]CAF2069390.1 unnamed protein product [Rotaria magnacalcarata]CAF2147877.1 unnamed protein product [Rotaria magnacalcarata]